MQVPLCDNGMKVYFDEVLQYQDNADPNANPYAWSITTELVIPRGTKVLGIECQDQGGSKGILASTTDGQMTDESWSCSSNQNLRGWAEPGFTDTDGDFPTPSDLKLNEDGPGGLRPNISKDVRWIWGNKNSAFSVCRKKIGSIIILFGKVERLPN